MEQKLKSIMSDVFNVRESDINDLTSMNSIGQWDSLKHIELITVIEQNFGVTFTSKEIAEMTSMTTIKEALSNQVNNSKEKQ